MNNFLSCVVFCCQTWHFWLKQFELHIYAKQKQFLKNYSISFIFAFQEHQKFFFKVSRKATMQIFPLVPTMVVPMRNTYINNEFLALLLPVSTFTDMLLMMYLQPAYLSSAGYWDARGWIKNSSIHYEIMGAI